MKRLPIWVACVVLACATLAVYWEVPDFSFTNYDDGEYVTDNPHVLGGLDRDGIRWAFVTTYQANWHPLTWLSLMLDAHLSGSSPRTFHWTSILLHVANTLVLFLFFDRATGFRGRSLFVASLFALHPLHVESVAWVAERKDVLSTLFGFLALLLWQRRVAGPSRVRYIASLSAFALGLLAKPMLVSLPLVLLLLDLWPFRRSRLGISALVREKIPFFVLALASSVVTLYAQRAGGALGTLDTYSLTSRLENAVVALASYAWRAFWPRQLAAFYPHPKGDVSGFALLGSAGFLLAATAGAWLARRGRPFLAVGWFWYLITLVPVIGIVQVGLQATADRYTYVPLVGIFLVIAWGVPELAIELSGARATERGRTRLRVSLALVAIAAAAVVGGLARAQTRYWRDGISLFERALAVTRENPVVRNNLGAAYDKRGRAGDLERAVVHYTEAVRIYPEYAVALNNLAGALERLGRTDEAVARWRDAVRVKPQYTAALCNLAGALIRAGSVDEGAEHCRRALRSAPDAPCAHYNLGLALLKQGSLVEAGGHFATAVRLDPRSTDARLNLGVVLARQGRLDEAALQFREILRVAPDHELARRNLELAEKRRQGAP